MKPFLPALAIVAMIVTVLVTLTMVVMCAAMGANSNAAGIRALKWWMAGFSLLGLAGIVGGIILLRAGRPDWAMGAALLPTGIMGLISVIALLK